MHFAVLRLRRMVTLSSDCTDKLSDTELNFIIAYQCLEIIGYM
jgi:hypothetical protein